MGSVKDLIEQADEIPFYSWGYGRVYTEGGESPFSKTAISITVQTDLT